MSKFKRLILVTICVLSPLSHLWAQQHRLWYSRPATCWLEALPLGNSHLGAMVYGGTFTEEIQLNEETFWSGSPHNNNAAEAKEHLEEVRQLIFEGREEKADSLIGVDFVKGPHGMRFQSLGSVMLKMGHISVSQYERELNIADAINTTQYVHKGVTYRREAFASLADNVLVVRLTASQPQAMDFAVTFNQGQLSIDRGQLTAIVKNDEQEGVPAGLMAPSPSWSIALGHRRVARCLAPLN